MKGEFGEVLRRAGPKSQDELRALLDLDVPVVLSGMNDLAAASWSVE
jgi:hypothetical protein